jgi:isopenicillin-N epimerase
MSTLALGIARVPTFAQREAGLVVPTGAGTPDDEPFWSAVRDQFEPDVEGRANLVTVVRGITPKVVRERIAEETTRFNRFGFTQPIDPDWRARLKSKVAAFIGAPSDSIALVRNTTEGVTTVLLNWPLQRGDEILSSSAEHGPFNGTYAQRAARDDIVSKKFHLPAPTMSTEAIVTAVDAAMTPRTKLVTIGHVVLTGQIMPVRAIADLVHKRGARLMVDGVLAIGQVATDVNAMDCDFYAAGFHKLASGPRGTAAFYVRPELVEQLPPLFGATGRDASSGRVVPMFASNRMTKYESYGAHPDPHFIALEPTLDFVTGIAVKRIQARAFALTKRWYSRVDANPKFRGAVALDPVHCAGLVSFEIAGMPAARVYEALRDRGILTGGTEEYAGFFGIPLDQPRGIRCANVGLATSPVDVDRLAAALEEIARS